MSDPRNPRYDKEYELRATWERAHDVHAKLVPFKHKKYDPWDILIDLRREIEKLPRTAATWRVSETDYEGQLTTPQARLFLLACLGSYPVTESNDKHSRLANPDYIHHEKRNRTCVLPRGEQIERCAATGLWSSYETAMQFGQTSKSIRRWCLSDGKAWGDRRDEGRKRMANAMLITHEWTGREYQEMASALGMSKSNVSEWIKFYGTLDEAPEYPNEQWAAPDSGYYAGRCR